MLSENKWSSRKIYKQFTNAFEDRKDVVVTLRIALEVAQIKVPVNRVHPGLLLIDLNLQRMLYAGQRLGNQNTRMCCT